jgi:multiple sugar transport system permease protein
LILTMTIFITTWRLLTFELVYGMTAGGPGNATDLLSYWVYRQAFGSMNFGYAAAISLILFGFILLIGLLGIFFVRRAWARFY